MAQNPHGDAPHGPAAGPPHRPGTAGLRLLLRLTLISFAASVLDGVVQGLTGSGPVLVPRGLTAVPGLSTAVLAADLVLTTALYTLVWFPLRRRLQWGWVLGLVFCSLAVLGGVFNLPVFVLDGHLPAAASTLVLVAVNVLWLTVAGRSDVRAVLR
ncbi:hypothetical protein ACH9EU_00160 [Kocuria sp. M1R5S2]|uniref:hypothetical protein n=1 Tax=Kocuria rhizosphaerae TaxID=3376285 RepID=UPI003792455F